MRQNNNSAQEFCCLNNKKELRITLKQDMILHVIHLVWNTMRPFVFLRIYFLSMTKARTKVIYILFLTISLCYLYFAAFLYVSETYLKIRTFQMSKERFLSDFLHTPTERFIVSKRSIFRVTKLFSKIHQ